MVGKLDGLLPHPLAVDFSHRLLRSFDGLRPLGEGERLDDP
jgi:hypothetical protein